jgi:peptidoglycan/xylan/chitin deacetylase (PgdA/CDA1 family)
VTLGNHTSTHPDLATLEPVQLDAEIDQARLELEREFDVVADQFCYPYGNYSADALERVRQSHAIGLTTEDRPIRWRDEPHLIPRLHGHLEWWVAIRVD